MKTLGVLPARRVCALCLYVLVATLLAACAAPAREFKSLFRWQPVAAAARIDAHVRVDTYYSYAGDVPRMDGELNRQRAQAVAELIVEDMAASQAFASVNAPARATYDLRIEIRVEEHKANASASERTLQMTATVNDPRTAATLGEYRRARVLVAGRGSLEEYKATMAGWLGEIRAEMLASINRGAPHAAHAAASRPPALPPPGAPAPPSATPGDPSTARVQSGGTPPRAGAADRATGAPRQVALWGMTVDAAGHGVVIRSVEPRSAAASAGVRAGDVVRSVSGVPIASLQDWRVLGETVPLFTPVPFTLQRDGRAVQVHFAVPGRVRLAVRSTLAPFTIPGVPPASAAADPSPMDALDRFNVLERVVLDPATGAIAVIGRYDPSFRTGPIPYLDLLKTALAHPTPRLNIFPTPETAGQLTALWPEIVSKLRHFNFTEVIEAVQGHPDLDRDRQLMVRELAKGYGVSPDEYAAWYNFARLDAQREETTDPLPPAAVRETKIKAFRALGYDDVATALGHLYQWKRDGAAQALRLLGRGEQAAAILAGGGDVFGALVVAAHLAIAERTETLSAENLVTLRTLYAEKRMGAGNVAKVAESAMPYMAKSSRVSLMHRAFNRIVLSSPAGLLAFPRLRDGRSFIQPLDLDRTSQLARIMYEADYAFKSVSERPELFVGIPGFTDKVDFMARDMQLADDGAKSSRIWMEPQSVSMAVSPDRTVIDIAGARMNVRAADGSDVVDFSAPDAAKPHAYVLWTSRHIMDHYDEYARIVPAFHAVREAAKVIALAQWLRAEKIAVDLRDTPQTTWAMPESIPMLSLITQMFVALPNGGSQATTFLTTEGGVSFKPRGNWTSMTPAPQGETRASGQLAVSADLGQRAVQALRDNDLEAARHLAELSAQAMSGAVSSADLTRLKIAVPPANPAALSPAQVQLQKELLRQTTRQIEAFKQHPGSRTTAAGTLEQLDALYAGARSNPVAASDYLRKLQLGQLVTASKPTPPGSPGSPAAADVKPPRLADACAARIAPPEALPGDRALLLDAEIADARHRLRHINEALRKLMALNAAQRAEIDKTTAEISHAYDAATARAYDFAVNTLVDLPLAKYADLHKEKIRELEHLISGQIALSTTAMDPSARKAVELDIQMLGALKERYKDAFASTERLLQLHAGAGFGRDISKWEAETRDSTLRKRGLEATTLAGKILLEHPYLEKYLSRQDWFGANKLWQVVAMGKMAAYASDFFWDIANQYAAWGPLAASLQRDLQFNAAAMAQLREKAGRTMQEIGCLESLTHQ